MPHLLSLYSQPIQPESADAAANKPVSCPLPEVDAKAWPESHKAETMIDKLLTDTNSLTPALQAFVSAMKGFEGALCVSQLFDQQMEDLATIFTTSNDLLKLLMSFKFDFINEILEPAETVVVKQTAAANAVRNDVPKLIEAVKTVDTAAEPVAKLLLQRDGGDEAAEGNVLLDNKVLHHLDGWKTGIRQLVAMIEEGHKQSSTLSDNEQHQKDLDR